MSGSGPGVAQFGKEAAGAIGLSDIKIVTLAP